MRIPRSAALLLAALAVSLVAACSGSAPTTPKPTLTPASTPSTPGAGAVRIEVTLTDALRIEPAQIRVPAGVPVTFVVTNTGTLEHELYVGDSAAQDAHEVEMAGGADMHDHRDGIGVRPGQTKELTMTFQAGASLLGGCHVQGHYLAGMKTVITVE